MKNEILLEVWRNRDDFAKQHNYDLKSMVKALQKSERICRNPLVDRTKKKAGKSSKPISRSKKS
jgi:hypothetical protein